MLYVLCIQVLIISHASSTTSFTASSKISIPFARSAREIFNGGMNRTVSYPDVGSKRRPFSIQRLTNLIFIGKLVGVPFTAGSKVGCEGEANSTAIIKPCPRMSRMCGPAVESAFSAFKALNSSADLKNRTWLRTHDQFGGNTNAPRIDVLEDLLLLECIGNCDGCST